MSPISGFPEWLPEQRIVELKWMDDIRRVFESYGYCSIETPSVEEIEALLAKGETDKEIYTVQRLHRDDEAGEPRLGLHYDLTVPLARYVAEHFHDLVFPFKRYQVQRAWRGERPQEGRYREFYQCDIDVINLDQLPLHFDAEIPAIMYDILSRLEVGDFQIRVSNRKILEGYFRGLGIEDTISAIRLVDKLDKIGEDGVLSSLQSDLALPREVALRCLALATIRTTDLSFAERVRALGVEHSSSMHSTRCRKGRCWPTCQLPVASTTTREPSMRPRYSNFLLLEVSVRVGAMTISRVLSSSASSQEWGYLSV